MPHSPRHPHNSEVTPAAIAAVFSTVTRTNRDGQLSIRDLRQWYITFGRHALAAGLDVTAPGAAIVAPALVKTKSFSTGSGAGALEGGAGGATQRSAAAASGRLTARGGTFASNGGGSNGGGGNLSGRHAAAAAALLGDSAGAAAGDATTGHGASSTEKPMYSWERGPAVHSAGEFTPALPGSSGAGGAGGVTAGAWSSTPSANPPASAAAASAAPLPSLPHGLVEFQVRLTTEEFADLQLRRRMADAEAAYRRRGEEGRAAKRPGGGGAEEGANLVFGPAGGGGGGGTVSQLRTAEPYVDPADRNAYFLRSD